MLSHSSVVCLFSILWIAVCQSALVPVKIESRIIGGIENGVEKVPYTVYIESNGKYLCSGTLVAPNKVLTVAHCVDGKQTKDLEVIGGAGFEEDPGVRRKVNRFIVPNDYNPHTLRNDYAVLKLEAPMEDDNTKPIALCTKPLTDGANVTISGWGTNSEHFLAVAVNTVTVPIVSKEKCTEAYRNAKKKLDTTNILCAGIPNRKNACDTDAGGPLVFNNEVCGIISRGTNCDDINDVPSLYTDVYKLRKMINTAIKMI